MSSGLLVNIAGIGSIIDNFIDYVREKHNVEIDKQDFLNYTNIKSIPKDTKKPVAKVASTEPAAPKPKCIQTVKKTGKQCVKNAAPNSEYCNIHTPKTALAQPKLAPKIVKKPTTTDEQAKKNNLKNLIVTKAAKAPEEQSEEAAETIENEDIELTEEVTEEEYVVETPKRQAITLNNKPKMPSASMPLTANSNLLSSKLKLTGVGKK